MAFTRSRVRVPPAPPSEISMARPELVKNIPREERLPRLTPENEVVLKTTKEIVVKFIEMGRCSPASFDEVFRSVFKTIKDTVTSED